MNTDSQNSTQFDVIRDEPADEGNTCARVADAYEALNGSKISRLEPKALVTIGSGTVQLDMTHQAIKSFKVPATIGEAKTWSLANAENAHTVLSFLFSMSDTYTQTMPAGWKMAKAEGTWDAAAHAWTPFDSGDFEAVANYNGSNWILKIFGPF